MCRVHNHMFRYEISNHHHTRVKVSFLYFQFFCRSRVENNKNEYTVKAEDVENHIRNTFYHKKVECKHLKATKTKKN